MGRILRDGHVPPAKRRRRREAVASRGKRANAELPLNWTVFGVAERIGIGPVAHEHRVAELPDSAALLLLVAQRAFGGDRAYPGLGLIERRHSPRVVHRDRSVRLDDLAAAIRLDPFERVAG